MEYFNKSNKEIYLHSSMDRLETKIEFLNKAYRIVFTFQYG